jgi:hypothetical protein
VARGAADVAFLLGEDHLAEARSRARLVAAPGPTRAPVLTGLWTRELHAAITAPAGMTTGRGGACVVAQGRRLAELTLEAAHEGGLPVEAAFTADELTVLVPLVRALPERARVLLALHAGVATEHLFQLAGLGQRLLCLLAREGELAEIARALGLAVARSPAELAALALLGDAAVPGQGAVLLEARHPEEAALLADAARRAGLSPTTRRSDGDKLPVISASGQGPALLRTRRGARPLPATRDVLEALSTLARLPALAPVGRRPRVSVSRARRLLDGWHRELHQVQLQEILSCYGLEGPPSALASSASMAGSLAGKVGFPVAVKAVGPTLRHRGALGAVRLDVDTAAGARQAFRDVLHACSVVEPRPILEGVLVQAAAPVQHGLRCQLRWLPEAPLMRIEVPSPGTARFAVCPMPRAVAGELADELAVRFPDVARGGMARFLHRLSWLGADLAGRMRWLWIDAVSLPGGRSPALVVNAYGEQTESLRAPSW